MIGVGVNNLVSGNNSAILSGFENEVSGDSSVILGGLNNTISGDLSLTFGKGITVDNNYETVFYDGSPSGKVGINEESPDKELHVNGTAYINDILKLEPRESAPDPPERGMIYYDDEDEIKYYDGSDWRTLAIE